jgi:hypothetical protein
VSDGQLNSPPATVTITTINSPPFANAGANQTVFVNSIVHLDGSGSSDVDGDPLTYQVVADHRSRWKHGTTFCIQVSRTFCLTFASLWAKLSSPVRRRTPPESRFLVGSFAGQASGGEWDAFPALEPGQARSSSGDSK